VGVRSAVSRRVTLHDMPKETLPVRVGPETREALAAYVETHRWQVEHIRQGLREAKAGKLVGESTVRKTLARLRSE
jgi:hypothetical protein